MRGCSEGEGWKIMPVAVIAKSIHSNDVTKSFSDFSADYHAADLHVVPCVSSDQFATMTASGCPCFVLRAAPFVFGLIASQLALAISFRFGTRTPCCGHGLDHRRRQPHRRGGKLEQLNGRITPFRERRRCQHTGLTPLTLIHYISNTQTFVLKYKDNRTFSQERRAA